jgi:hypothetical protein
MKNRLVSLLVMALLLLVPAVFCQAAESPGNDRLLCAITEVVECSALGECLELAAEDVGLPDFLIIDLEAKKIMEATSVSLRENSFTTSSVREGVTILNGVDAVRGWSAVLSSNNTRLSASVSDEGAGFVLFGNCKVEP